MFEVISDPTFVWGLSGLILIFAEALVPGFVIFFFGSGALLTALASAVLPPVGASFGLQGLIWGVSSVFSLIFLRKRFSRVFRGTILNRERVEELGETALVKERITPDEPGRVRYQGTTWKAVSYTETFEPGEKVSIVQEDGLTLVVSAPIVQDYGE
jgi:membrane protein implicated in regulation of membrane protease activity